MPTSARAPADVAPSATVVGLGRLVDAVGDFFKRRADDVFGVDDVGACDAEVAGLGATFDVSCAALKDDADKVIAASNSVTARRRILVVVNTELDRGGGG